MNRTLIILAVVTAVVAVLAFSLVDVIPPRSLTAARMQVLKRRVLHYAQAHGELPKSLAVLPAMEGYDNSTRDAWKRDIIFEVSTSGVVTFRSFGRDGVVGGAGDNADIIRSFPARDTHGRWNDERVEWSEDTFRK
jgi:Type II secretion system (T2SS), protein G